jgi:hypothetical protein
MLTIFTTTANATTLQDLIDERSARDVVDLAAHRRQRAEGCHPKSGGSSKRPPVQCSESDSEHRRCHL